MPTHITQIKQEFRSTDVIKSRVASGLIWAAFLSMAASPAAQAQKPMFDPVIDRPDAEWCYAAKSTTVIGLPFVPVPVQVTYDGAIYTRHAELAFFHGDPLEPLMARNKTFLEGWIPVVQYQWSRGGVDYQVEMFSAELPELGRGNLVQFARLTMENPGTTPVTGVVAAGLRGTAGHFRLGPVRPPVAPLTRFSMEDHRVLRDGSLVYAFAEGADLLAVPDAPYSEPYTAVEHALTDRAETALAVFRRTLQPGERFSAEFAMPRVPLSDPALFETILPSDYDRHRADVIRFWNDTLGDTAFEIPEARVQDSYRASLVHLLLASRDNGGKRQGSGLPYDDLFLNDYMDMLTAYITAGLHELTEPNVDWLQRKQHESGMFMDVHNRGRTDFVTSHGQGVYALAYPALVTRDLDYARRVYPTIRKGAEFIINDHRNHNEHGLLRPSVPYDAPMLTGYHTCHNLFALTALRASIRVARLLNETADAEEWAGAEKTYREAILRAIEHTFEKEGYIHPALYDWTAGMVQDNPALGVNDFPAQDWENNLLVYPTELLEPDDPRVAVTLETIRSRKYREGVMSYRNGMHIHQYVTLNQAQQYRAIGDQRHALLDLYHVLLHNGSTHEGFENLVDPWSTRTPAANCPPPHAWAAAKIALFIRNMMVCEYGGQMGLYEDQRELHLFGLVSPYWVKPGQRVAIHNAPTEMGPLSASLTFSDTGAALAVEPQFHTAPRYLAVRVPYHVQLENFTSDARESFERDGMVYFSPDVTRADFVWNERPAVHEGNFQDILKGYRSEFGFIVKDRNYDPARAGQPFLLDDEKEHPPEPLSFDLVRRAFLKEYGRRFQEYVAAGGKPYPVEPPAILTADQRTAGFARQFGADARDAFSPEQLGIAVGKPVTASASLPGHGPERAVDGIATQLSSSWQADPYPAWLKIDLERPARIDRIHVFPYWGGGRIYHYTIDASLDGETWVQVVNFMENGSPATPEGDLHSIEAREARYLRLNMLYHSLNRGVHVVEIRAFEAETD